MENPFKKILNYEKLPESFKEKVMGDISLVKFTIEVADLFVIKFPNTITSFLITENNSEKGEEEGKEEQ